MSASFDVMRGEQLSALIAERTGLHFPRERWTDLERGLTSAAAELGFENAAACADWLLRASPTRAQIHALASHLTVGETYFFRDVAMFEELASMVLPPIIRARRGGEQRIRIWSAACCTGEEPYSLAILLHELLPDLDGWRITITATDINARFLQKAAAGIYGKWSFRNAQDARRKRYFTQTSDGRYAIVPEIRRLVTFAHLNLVEDVYPSLETGTNAMDLILCRNVLMYFSNAQVRKVIGNLRRSMIDGGWLIVSPSEASKALFPRFETVNVPGGIFFRKSETDERVRVETPEMAPAPELPRVGRSVVFRERTERRVASPDKSDPSHEARALANLGRLSAALECCERWIVADKMAAPAHYLRAVILQEQGSLQEASLSLRRAVYLDPNFVLAHFALGNVARRLDKSGEAEKHFANALDLLRRQAPDEVLPESEGLTAGRLAETIASMTEEAVPR